MTDDESMKIKPYDKRNSRLLSCRKNKNTATHKQEWEQTNNQTRQETNRRKLGWPCEIAPLVPDGPLDKDIPDQYIPRTEAR